MSTLEDQIEPESIALFSEDGVSCKAENGTQTPFAPDEKNLRVTLLVIGSLSGNSPIRFNILSLAPTTII
jgi:hypothetical protein